MPQQLPSATLAEAVRTEEVTPFSVHYSCKKIGLSQRLGVCECE